MESILTWSSGTPLHLIVITDKTVVTESDKLLVNTISKIVSQGVIKRRRKWKLRIPKIKLIFVDIEDIIAGNEDFINEMKKNTDKGILSSDYNAKYFHDLFYLGPVYHRKFVKLEKIIFLEVDLLFQVDILQLEKQF